MEPKIIESINEVNNILGSGLTESCYQKALVIELRKHFNIVEIEKAVPIVYKDHEITTCRADIVIDNKFILELKAVATKLGNKDEIQLKRYMNIFNISKGILVNFNITLEIKELEI